MWFLVGWDLFARSLHGAGRRGKCDAGAGAPAVNLGEWEGKPPFTPKQRSAAKVPTRKKKELPMRKFGIVVCGLLLAWSCTAQSYQVPRADEFSSPKECVLRVSSAAEVAALGEVAAGTEIVWTKGSYADQVITLQAAGTAEHPVRFRAEAPGEVCFTGTSRLVVKGSSVEVSGFWWQDPVAVKGKAILTFDRGSTGCVARECAITGHNSEQRLDVDAKWVSLFGSGHTVERCSFLDKRNMGTLLVVWLEAGGEAPRHHIVCNHFERPLTLFNAEGKAQNGQETIRIGDSRTSMQEAECTVEGNYFLRCHGEQAEIISNKSCGNLYRGNLFEQSHGTLTLRHGNRCWVTGNYFLGGGAEGSGGVRLIGEGHTVENNYMQGLRGSGYKSAICLVRGQSNPALSGYWQVKGCCVRNNIVVDCRYGICVNYGSSGQVMPVVETKIEQNVVSLTQESDYSLYCVEEPAPQIEWLNNQLYGGRQHGVALPTLDTPPTLPRVEVAVDNIRRRAGVSW